MAFIYQILKQFIKFAAVGILGLVANLGVTYLFTELFGFWYFLSFLIATLVAWTLMFMVNSIFTFAGHSKENYGNKFLIFLIVYLGAFLVNASLVYAQTSIFFIHYLISISTATIITSIITFTLSKKFVYRV